MKLLVYTALTFVSLVAYLSIGMFETFPSYFSALKAGKIEWRSVAEIVRIAGLLWPAVAIPIALKFISKNSGPLD